MSKEIVDEFTLCFKPYPWFAYAHIDFSQKFPTELCVHIMNNFDFDIKKIKDIIPKTFEGYAVVIFE